MATDKQITPSRKGVDIAMATSAHDKAVQAVVIAASSPIKGCFNEGIGNCGGTHTDCYYGALVDAVDPIIRADERH